MALMKGMAPVASEGGNSGETLETGFPFCRTSIEIRRSWAG
jgi:hypothetical protein